MGYGAVGKFVSEKCFVLGSQEWTKRDGDVGKSDVPVDELFVAGIDGSQAHSHKIGEHPRMRALSGGTVHAAIITRQK